MSAFPSLSVIHPAVIGHLLCATLWLSLGDTDRIFPSLIGPLSDLG